MQKSENISEEKEKCTACQRVVARDEITENGCIICLEEGQETNQYDMIKEEQMGIPEW